eukprot:6190750-Pleurochrysis_carterae.AAC.1
MDLRLVCRSGILLYIKRRSYDFGNKCYGTVLSHGSVVLSTSHALLQRSRSAAGLVRTEISRRGTSAPAGRSRQRSALSATTNAILR